MALQILVNGLVLGAVFGLVSFGYAIIYNTTRIFHIAYAAVLTATPYLMSICIEKWGVPVLVSFLLVLPATMLLSLIIEVAIYRPLAKRRSSPTMIMISSIGAMIVLVNAISILFGSGAKSLTLHIAKTAEIGPLILSQVQIFQFAVSAFLLVVSVLALRHSRFGLAIRAFRDDDELFGVMGRNGFRMRTVLFPLSGLYAAVGGGLIALDTGFTPQMGMPILLNAVVALIIGGVGRFESPMLGGMIIGMLQALGMLVLSSRWQEVVTFLVLIIFLLFRPQGILGERLRKV